MSGSQPSLMNAPMGSTLVRGGATFRVWAPRAAVRQTQWAGGMPIAGRCARRISCATAHSPSRRAMQPSRPARRRCCCRRLCWPVAGPAWPRARVAPIGNGWIANWTRSWLWLPPISTASVFANAMAKSAATCSPFSRIPMRRPTIMAVNENCGRQPPIERSPAGFDPTGVLICSPMSDLSSAPPRDTASMHTMPYRRSCAACPCCSHRRCRGTCSVETAGLWVSWKACVRRFASSRAPWS